MDNKHGDGGPFRVKGFAPLFLTQALNAFDDNFFKSAILILVTYEGLALGTMPPEQVAVLVSAVFILPFFLFSAVGGQLADKFEKGLVVRILKGGQMALVAFAAFALFAHDTVLMLVAVALFGTQSAFFGPVKYAILPELVGRTRLVSATAFVEASTFVAILLATMGGSLVIRNQWGKELVIITLACLTITGFALAFLVPRTRAAAPGLTVNFNLLAGIWSQIRLIWARTDLWRLATAISWFWMGGIVIQTLVPVMAKSALNADETVTTLFFVLFSTGIGAGSLLSSRLARGRISIEPAIPGVIGLFAASIALYASVTHFTPAPGPYISLGTFVAMPGAAAIIASYLALTLAAGLFIVPLYTLLQEAAGEEERARVIAANNILNGFYMAAGTGAAFALQGAGLSATAIIGLFGMSFLPLTLLLYPEAVKRFIRL